MLTSPIYYEPTDSVIVPLEPIDSQIIMGIKEEIKPGKRSAALSFYTKRIYSQGGAKINGSLSIINNSIRVELKEIILPEVGPAISMPASVSFNLGELRNGSYTIRIIINGKEITGVITVSYESFDMKIRPNNIIICRQNTILRIPAYIIWGQAESIRPDHYGLFLDSLKILGAKEHNLKPGQYTYFDIDSQGNFDTHSVLGMPYGEFFLRSFEGDTLITRNLVKRFSKRYGDSVYIKLFGGRGEMYFSTVLKNEP
ncbi:hypothetical protein ACSSWA_06375 [Melioribacter sp. Ez-97]|uniref:hypothetical protein n=1 Tax=Melioribacter sp. Ez-97 TaxID=3423434 RepID=UPI003ED9AE37